MKTTFIYFAGVATPFLIALIYAAKCAFTDWRAHRRYQRAWDKFTAEWDEMSDRSKELFGETRQPYDQQMSERDRYFTVRWKYGHTTEV